MTKPSTIAGCGCPDLVAGYNAVGQTIYSGSGRVVDENGNGLAAGFFYVDKDGNQLSQEFVTDAQGGYHWEVDDSSVPFTFINFYATADYLPVVKTPDELFNNGTVVLERADKKLNAGSGAVVPILLGGGLLLLMAPGKKKVGALDVKGRWQKLDPTVKKVIIYGGGAVGAYLLFNYLAKRPNAEQQAEINAAQNCLTDLARNQGILPTLTALQLSDIIANLKDAIGGCGTDEAQVYGQIKKLNNMADVCKLIVVHGVQRYKSCFEEKTLFDIISGHVSYTVSQALYADLSPSEIGTVNQILADKGINYQF